MNKISEVICDKCGYKIYMKSMYSLFRFYGFRCYKCGSVMAGFKDIVYLIALIVINVVSLLLARYYDLIGKKYDSGWIKVNSKTGKVDIESKE